MAFCNPQSVIRRPRIAAASLLRLTVFLCGFFGSFAMLTGPAAAQGILLLRDTETERALLSYERPFLKAGGLEESAFHLYLVNDPSVNSFVAEGQNMFIQSGMILFAHNANELKGVMAHENRPHHRRPSQPRHRSRPESDDPDALVDDRRHRGDRGRRRAKRAC